MSFGSTLRLQLLLQHNMNHQSPSHQAIAIFNALEPLAPNDIIFFSLSNSISFIWTQKMYISSCQILRYASICVTLQNIIFAKINTNKQTKTIKV